MQLSKVKISNLFNFPYQANLERTEGVTFSNPEKNNVNVLIGPNGAGKSSFLNVINWVWKIGLVKDFIFHRDIILKKNARALKSVITTHDIFIPKVRRHFDFPDKESRIHIEFVLTHHDYENIGFIFKYREQLNALIAKYSNIGFSFPKVPLIDIHKMDDKIAFDFAVDVENKTITVQEDKLTDIEKFILDYLRNMELIQICIDIHNEFERKKGDRKWYPLKHSFAILGLKRNLKNISNHVDPDTWYDFISNTSSSKYESYIGFFLCARKIWNVLTHASEENVYEKHRPSTFSPVAIKKKLQKSDFFKSITFALNKYLEKSLVVEYDRGKLIFWLIDEFGHRLSFDDLSDGEQSLLIIIFTIYGYDLKHGMLIVDEPELYFHPQMQRNFIRMAEKISSNIGTQFILSTYSPLFVDEGNIANVYRFAKTKGKTTVQSPNFVLTPHEATLIHLLKFENMSKIFFVNKIIMVEGDTDQYFFEFYIKYLHTFPAWKEVLKDYEIININGKGSYRSWRHFLAKFGIESYFIGDRDNIVDFGIFTQEDVSDYYKEAKQYMRKARKQKKVISPYYGRLVNTLKDLYPQKYAFVNRKIQALYKKDIFILKRGDLETYLGMRNKGLEDTVVFCQNNFQERLKNKRFDDHRKNLDMILGTIFGLNK